MAIQFRRGTAATWTSANPVLAVGEPGFETDTGKHKIGDGSTAWVSLAYVPAGSVTPAGSSGDLQTNNGSGALGSVTQATFIAASEKAAASGVASLDGSSKAVQDPANATATPTASKIAIADGSGKLTGWVANMGGDAGSGGTAGLVPAPGSGDAAAGKYLKANGVWTTPPGGGLSVAGSSGDLQTNNGSGNLGSVTQATFLDATTVRNANKVFAGPTTGADAAPSFRTLVAADLPAGGGSPLTTKGDIYVYGSANDRLGVGANGKSIVAASGETLGLKYDYPIQLQTASIDNGSQIKLNLTPGTNISLVDNGTGSVAIAATGSFSGGGTSIYPNMTVPLTSNFSFLNPNAYAATATDKSDRLLLNIPASSLGLAYMQTSALPGSAYTIDLGVLIHSGVATVLGGIALKNSGGNALRTYSFRINAIPAFYTSDQSWTSVIAPGTENNTTGANIPPGFLLFIRVTDDGLATGTSRQILTSYNGKDYDLWLTQGYNTGVTPDRAGIILYNGAGGIEHVIVYHWLISGSVLDQYAS